MAYVDKKTGETTCADGFTIPADEYSETQSSSTELPDGNIQLPDGTICDHKDLRSGANASGAWRTCNKCGRRVEYINKKTKSVQKYANFTGMETEVLVADQVWGVNHSD